MTADECREVFEMLSEYIDGELPAGTCAEIERHIADCPPCVQFVESLKKSVQLCREYRPSAGPPPLSPEAKGRLAEAFQAMLERQPAKEAPG